jgi:hypothetical protein
VNSFRVVFNTYVGASLPLLPDRALRHVSDMQPFRLDDISGQLTTAAQSTVKAERSRRSPFWSIRCEQS